MPGLPAWSRTATIDQLIHQTSGIPDYVGLLYDAGYEDGDRTTNADALKALAKVKDLEFTPGTQWEYSNSNCLLLGQVIEAASGQSLSDFLRAEIFAPLGLNMVLDPARPVPTLAVSYTRDDGKYTVAPTAWEQTGHGSIRTTLSQLRCHLSLQQTRQLSHRRGRRPDVTCRANRRCGHDRRENRRTLRRRNLRRDRRDTGA